MFLQSTPAEVPTVEETVVQFVAAVVSWVPRLLSGLLFLAVAYLFIRAVRYVVRSLLERVYPANQKLVVSLAVAVLNVFLWFGASLALLKIVGLGEVAASLGTAAGFIGLGIAFALNEMIADTVAGVYLLRDPDFNEGYRVETANVTGTVEAIDLRKTRLRTDEDELVVLANRDVEEKWTKDPVEETAETGVTADAERVEAATTAEGEDSTGAATADGTVSGAERPTEGDDVTKSLATVVRRMLRRG